MRQIAMGRSLGMFLEELWFTEAAAAADPDAEDLAGLFATAIAEWEVIAHRERAGRRGVVRAEAVVGVRGGRLDEATRRLASAVLVEARSDRKHPLFKKFFPEAPSAFVARTLREHGEQTRDRIVPEIEALPEASPLRAFAPRLLTLSNDALAALTGRATSRGESASVGCDVQEWKEGINRLRSSAYAELHRRAVEKNLGREWPETFFRRDDDETLAPG